MTRFRMMLIVVLMLMAITAVVIFQGNWLINSYAVSKEKNEEEIRTMLDLAITEQKRQVADSVRHIIQQLVRSEKDFKYRFIEGRNGTKIGISGSDHESFALYDLSAQDTAILFKNSYKFLTRKMAVLKLDELYPLYLTLIGTKRYNENSPERLLQIKLSNSFNPCNNMDALKRVVYEMFSNQGRSFKGNIYCYQDISNVYNKPSQTVPFKIKQLKNSTNQDSSKSFSIFSGSDNSQSLAVKTDLLTTYIDSLNHNGDTVFVAKPLLYNFNNLYSNEITTILLTSKTSYTIIGRQMSSSIFGSFALMIFIVLSVTYMYHTILKQKQFSEIKNDFIGNISHELNTPIATAQAAIQGLKFFDLHQNPEKTDSYLNTASSEIQRLSVMVDKILNISLFESSAFRLSFGNFNLKSMIILIVKSQQVRTEKPVTINLRYSAKENIVADKMHLHNVLMNLVDNAIKYSGKQVVIGITCENYDNGVKITVTDNGHGIPMAYQAYIFDKFFRVPTVNGHTIKGYGLGLNYVRNIVKKHQGSISLSSSSEIGSIFVIKLPQL